MLFAFPLKLPEKVVDVKVPVEELNVKFVPVLGGKFPVAAVVKSILQLVSLDSSETVTFVAIEAFVAFVNKILYNSI